MRLQLIKCRIKTLFHGQSVSPLQIHLGEYRGSEFTSYLSELKASVLTSVNLTTDSPPFHGISYNIIDGPLLGAYEYQLSTECP